MLWVKTFHILFVISWFAGLFYLPRILVNLAMEQNPASIERLLLMANKLYRFSTILMIPAIVLGGVLWLGYGIGKGPGNGWMHLKLTCVLALVAYHFVCRALLTSFEQGKNRRSHVWFRWFNEIPVLLLLIVLIMVVVKPF